MDRGTRFAFLVFNAMNPGKVSQGFFVSLGTTQGGNYDELWKLKL
jgi:hypothetical protein